MGDVLEISDTDESIEALREKAKQVQFALLTTIGPDGLPRSRPMATQDIGEDGLLWFFTWADSRKVADIGSHPEVSVEFASPDKNLWVTVNGRARVIADQDMRHRLWQPPLKAFFPDGPDDDNVTLIQVIPSEGEIWDGPSTTVGRAVAFAKTYVKGADQEPPGDDVKLRF